MSSVPFGRPGSGCSCTADIARRPLTGGSAGGPGVTTTCNSQYSPINNTCDSDAVPTVMPYIPSSFDLTAMPTCPPVD